MSGYSSCVRDKGLVYDRNRDVWRSQIDINYIEQLEDKIRAMTAELSEARADSDISDAANVALHGALQTAEAEIDRLTAELTDYRVLAAEYGIDGETMLTLAKSQIETAKENAKLTAELSEYKAMELTPSEYIEGVNFILRMNKTIKQATGKTALDWEQLTAENAAKDAEIARLAEQRDWALNTANANAKLFDESQRRLVAAVKDI